MNDRLAALSGSGPRAGAAPRRKMSPGMLMVANIGMFIITAAACFLVIRGAKAFVAGPGGGAGFILTTTRTVEPGESFTELNSRWTAVTGRAPVGVVLSPTRAGPGGVYFATARIGAEKPVRASLVRRQDSVGLKPDPDLTGFVFAGGGVNEIMPYVKAGDRVDVVAVMSDELGRRGGRPQVSTVVSGAKVLAVTPGGRASRPSSMVLGVSDDEVRKMTLLRQVASLSLVLPPLRAGASDQPSSAWRSVEDMGLPSSGVAPVAEPVATRVSTGVARSAPVAAAAAADDESITIITPGGSSKAAFTQ